MNQEIIWKIIDKYFKENPYSLVEHNLESYNNFFGKELTNIFIQNNPIKILKQQDEKTGEFNLTCHLYLGGKKGDKIYYGKPIIYDEHRQHYMYPNEARLRNMNYGMTIHYDVEVEYHIVTDKGEILDETIILDKIYLGKFPIMLHSNYCILKGMTRSLQFYCGECRNDMGGYFIIDGKEKTIVSQEKFADNLLYIRAAKKNLLIDDKFSHSVEVKSRSEDPSKPVRTTYVRLIAPGPLYTNRQVVVMIPNVRAPIPLFIVMRALGILSDKSIIETCILDIHTYSDYLEDFRPSIHDCHGIYNQLTALQFIKEFTKEKTIVKVQDILMNYFIPHIGTNNYKQKALFLGYMTYKLLRVAKGIEKPTDRDNFMYKRIETPGVLLNGLFKEYYKMMLQTIYTKIDKEYYYHVNQYQNEQFLNLVQNNFKMFFSERTVETGFKKAFKGNWGAQAHTKKLGVIQDLNRLSFNSALSQRRKTNLPLQASAKVIGPRLLHGSQIGYIDPVDTPDGGNVGLHKHLAILTKISTAASGYPLIQWLRQYKLIRYIQECNPVYLSKHVKLFINGAWIGVTDNPIHLIDTFRNHRRHNIIPIWCSISWFISDAKIDIYTDAGRLLRPIFYIDKGISLENHPDLMKRILDYKFTWKELIGEKDKEKQYTFNTSLTMDTAAVIDYIDTNEEANTLIAFEKEDLGPRHTHLEIHASLMLGVMGNQIIYPANNQLPRDLFSCGQSKQAVSLYSSNYQVRIDKTALILNYGQLPLVKSRYLQYINHEEHPYGENVIVAIGVYGSYNVEDSILFNQGSIDRGMFRTTYFNAYEAREESSQVSGSVIDTRFTNIETEANVAKLKAGYDYSHLDKSGLIKKDTYIDEKTILIGKVVTSSDESDISIDDSVGSKKGQVGYIDKTFITDGEEGFRIAKVRVRNERIPAIGDKFCSRCGQKGTIGRIIPEEDMPFTEDGLRPDIIVNPHAFPSRMTIGQLVETLSGILGCEMGAFGDCTAFLNKGSKHKLFGQLLTNLGYNHTGNQILYSGESGVQVESNFYIGPTYYMRLKHMVKDKINYRARGPRTALTRQTVQGRSNDGGLRIGEMERDGVLAHGMSYFLNESLMVRGDEYYMAICNNSGMIAIYNQTKDIFLSPMVDGPIRFSDTNPPFEAGSLYNISKYGKQFSVIRIPYTFKLLIHELSTMGVWLRLITEDNIDQLDNMNFSHTIDVDTVIKPTPKKAAFKIGDTVYYKNDTEENRIWTVNAVDKNEYTISTENKTNLPSYATDGTFITNEKTLEKTNDIATSIINTITETLVPKDFTQNISNTMEDVTNTINDTVNTAQKSVTDYTSNISDELKDVTESFNSLASQDIPSTVNHLAQQTVDSANHLAKTIVSKAENLVDSMKESTFGDESKKTLETVGTNVEKALENIGEDTLTDLENVEDNIGKDTKATLESVKKITKLEPIETEIENKLQTITKEATLDKEPESEIKKI